jgi:S-layer protein
VVPRKGVFLGFLCKRNFFKPFKGKNQMAANLSQLFVGLFNAATGGYANQFTTSDANNLASVASMVTGKDLSNNTAFVNNVLTNLGVPASGAVRDAAFSAVLALVNTSGRGNAVLTAADYLANVAAKDATNQYYAVGQSFVAKVAAADAFTQTHSTELSAAALVGAATGTSTGTGFTAGTDTLLGTIGSDVFSSASGTLSTADKLIDSSTADSDILNIVFKSADVAAVPQPTINNIENINVSFDMIAGAEFDATNVTGATIGLSSPRSSFIGDVTIDAQGANNVKAGAGISGTVTVNGMNGGSIDLGSAKALTSTKATVTNKAVGYDLTVNGTATALDLDFGGTTNKILTLTATKDTTVTFDGTNTVATTIRGSGAGAITIKDAAANFTKATVTGISKLNMTKAGTASLTSVSSSTAIEASATGTYTLTALNGQSVTASFADTDLSLAPKTAGVSTVSVNVTANQSAGTGIVVGATTGFASAAVTLGPKVTAVNSLAYSGDTTVAIGGTTTITTLAELATTDTIKFSGSGSLTLDTTATDVAHNVDASGVTGDFTAKLGDTSTAAVIVGAQGTNTVETIETKGSVTYTGGAGKDTLTLASTTGKVTANLGDGTNKVVFTPAFASAKAVVNGGSGGDTIEIKDGTFAASASLTAHWALETTL